MLFLNLHNRGFDVAGIFWGLWLFPLGLLVYRSGFFPPHPGGLADGELLHLSGNQSDFLSPATVRSHRLPMDDAVRLRRHEACEGEVVEGSKGCFRRDSYRGVFADAEKGGLS